MLKVALCQMPVVQGDRVANHAAAARMIERGAALGADVVVLPEMWSCGYDFDHLEAHRETLAGPSLTHLRELAERHKVWVIGGSLPIVMDDGVRNMAVVLSPAGDRIHTYSKTHLIGLMGEDRFLTAGGEAETFELAGIPAATLICYDLRFPELARRYARLGAKILFVPAEWPSVRQAHWDVLVRARAIENQAFVVAVNMCGSNSDDVFTGGSIVVDPWGDVLVQAGDQPEVIVVDLDESIVNDVRSGMSVLQDVRPELY